MSKEHTYINGEVTIVWKSELCIHSKKCWTGLGEVFRPGERPWIKPDGVETDRIIAQVKQCPSGALSYRMNDGAQPVEATGSEKIRVEIAGNGPLLINGTCEVIHADGRIELREKVTAFCRCGASVNKPYCDGSHRKLGFIG
jgi:uncharacterized Fe-S cluster protein YjdI